MITYVHGLKIGDIVKRHGIRFLITGFPTVHLARLEPVERRNGCVEALVPITQLEGKRRK